jgi:hypothetical protein
MRQGELQDGNVCHNECDLTLCHPNLHRGMAMMSRDEQVKLKGRHQLDFMYQEPPGYKDRTFKTLPGCAINSHLTCGATASKLELKPQEIDMSQMTYQEQKQLPIAQRLKHLKNAPRIEV